MAAVTPANDFVAKHWQRWPEWQFASVFLAEDQRALIHDWYALQNELWLAAYSFEDPTPGAAKLAWWQEELRGWSKGMRRHPLGASLQPRSTHWNELADQLTLPFDDGALASVLSKIDHDLAGSRGMAHTPSIADALSFERSLLRDDSSAVSSSPKLRGLSRARAMQVALSAARAKSSDVTKPLSPLRTILTCWRAARMSKS